MSEYLIDWADVGNNGQTTTLLDGTNSIDVTVSTPDNDDHQEFETAHVDGKTVLEARCVDDPVVTKITFDAPVSNLSFDLLDVDQGHGWDDRVTIIARDAHGNIVPVDFSGLTHHDVCDNTVEGGGSSGGAFSLSSPDNVHVSIAGPIVSLEIILDDGASAHQSGTVGIGPIAFNAAAQPDGYVDGSSGNDVIDAAYVDDDGDAVDSNDQILPGEGTDDDVILAGAGDDTVKAGAGDDEVFAGPGNDVVRGQAGNDYLNGGDGNDMLFGGSGDDGIVGGAGDDKVEGSQGSDAIAGGDGQDDLWGGKNDDVISGGRGADTIDAGDGHDLVFGGQGADNISGGAGNDTIYGGSQPVNENIDFNDLQAGELVTTQFIDKGFTVSSGEPKTPVMVFDSAHPTGGDSDLATHNLGKVLILSEDRDPDDPDDNASGGQFIFDFENPAKIVNLGFLDIEGGATITLTFADGTTQDVAVPSTANNGQVTQWLNAEDVMQMVVTLTDSGAIDNLCFEIDPDAGDGNDVIDAGDGDDLVFGNAGDDTILGGTGTDEIFGGTGADTLEGGVGDDTLDLGTGPDGLPDGDSDVVVFSDGHGNDRITNFDLPIVNPDGSLTGIDTLDVSDLTDADGNPVNTSDVTVSQNADGDAVLTFPNGETITFVGVAPEQVNDEAELVAIGIPPDLRDGIVSGTDGDDVIDIAYDGDPEGDRVDNNDAILGANPGSNDDIIEAGDGDDIVHAGEGNDTVFGGNGSDTVLGGDGDDVIDTSGDMPRLDLGFPGYDIDPSDPNNPVVPPLPADADPDDDKDIVDGGAGDDTIRTGDDADIISGGAGNDWIDGGIDADTISGGDGDDRIVGGEGSDTISGGDGNDTIYAGIDPALGLPDNLDIPDSGLTQPADPEPSNGQDVVSGGAGDDIIFGQDDNDTLSGDEGNDYIDGGFDEDTISGGAGDDTIIGGEAGDLQSGGSGEDTFLVGSAEEGIGDVIDGGQAASGPDTEIDTLDLTGSGNIKITYTSADKEDGIVEFRDDNDLVTGTLTFTEIENVIPCFTPGTTIATPKGERLVEELKVGDRIITRDNGLQEIRWIGRKNVDWKLLSGNPHLKPVLIRKGALGNDLPERDMLVSPNHRVLVSNDRTALYFEEREVLAAAKHLVNNNGIHEVDTTGTAYIHFMFDQHEVVLSNGAWTESFQPGDYSLKGIGNAQRNEIYDLFPELKEAEGINEYRSARKTLKKHEAKLLLG